MKDFFYLLKCKPTEELVFLFDCQEGVEYTLVKKNGFDAYKITLNLDRNKVLADVIGDINIFIPKVNKYISDYILLKKTPSKAIISYLNLFTSDDLFLPYISKQRMDRATIKHCERYKHLGSNRG